MTSAARIYALCDAIDYLCRCDLAGDIVECGVWKGGSMMAAAKTLLNNDCRNRRLWLFDTFDGMTAPTNKDIDFLGHDALETMSQSPITESNSIWCRSPIDEVKQNIESTGYPPELIEYVVGDVAETLPVKNIPERIALLRLDTDWYDSTKMELETMFPRLIPGGVLIIDDYGHWKGCRKAVDEYFAENDIDIFLNRIDYTGRIGIKNCMPDIQGAS